MRPWWLVLTVVACSSATKPVAPPPANDREVPTPEQPLKYGLVRGARQCVADGPFTTNLQLYRVPVRCADADAPGDFVWIQLLHGPTDAVPRAFTFPGPVRSDGLREVACYTDARLGPRCQEATVTLDLATVTAGTDATGTVEMTYEGRTERATFRATWCGGKYDVAPCAHSGR